MAERLGNRFVAVVRESGRPIPDDCMENIAKLGLTGEEPLMASEVLNAMLKNSNDPIKELEKAIRIADVPNSHASRKKNRELPVPSPQGNHFEIAQAVTTAEGARTLGLDPLSREIFLPTAESEPAISSR